MKRIFRSPVHLVILAIFCQTVVGQVNDGLLDAAFAGDTAKVKSFLASGADVNVKNSYGATPLMLASQEGHSESVKLLLAAKADVNARMPDGYTSLMFACQHGRGEIVTLLLEAKASINAKRSDGATPLLIASQTGYIATWLNSCLQPVQILMRVRQIARRRFLWPPKMVTAK